MANTCSLELVRRDYMQGGSMYRELDVLPWFSVFLKSVEGTRRQEVGGRYQGRYLGR